MRNQEAEFYSRSMEKYRDKCEALEAKNADLERKLSSIIDDCITENAYEFSQYCQSIDYEYTNQINDLEAKKVELKKKLEIAVEALKVVGWHCSDDGSHDPDEMYDVIEQALAAIKGEE